MTVLAQNPFLESKPTPMMPRALGPSGRMIWKPRIAPDTIGEKSDNIMMPNDILLYS